MLCRLTPLLIALACAGAASAQTGSGVPSALGYAPPSGQTAGGAWEARLGLGAANPGGREGGLLNFGGELLTPRIATLNDRIANAFVPRFHIGSSLNLNGTAFAYAGASWTFDLSDQVFVEAALGAAVNNGKSRGVVPTDRLNLGCDMGARGAASVGYRINDRWSLIATLEHFSAAGCSSSVAAGSPRGPANIGARLGYSF
jgi:lipid A 3-O-deacylase